MKYNAPEVIKLLFCYLSPHIPFHMNHSVGFPYSEPYVFFSRFEEESFTAGNVRDFCISVTLPDASDSPTSLVHVYIILGILAGIIFCSLLGAVLFLTRRHWLKGNVHFILRFISHDCVIFM
jgi:hypothetical protein